MFWPVLSLLNVLFESAKDVTAKHNLRNLNEYTLSLSLNLFSALFLLPTIFVFNIPEIGARFWPALIIGGSINTFASILYMKAIKSSDLSITVPMLSFTPLFLLATSPLIVKEFPSLTGLLGVMLIIFGSYFLNISQRQKGAFAPLKILIKEPGPKLMLLVAFLWSIAANFDKIGVNNSSPIFWSFATRTFLAIGILAVTYKNSKASFSEIRLNLKTLIPVGLFASLSLFFQMTAISLTLVAYVIAFKRTSILATSLAGHLIFKEKGLQERLPAAILMIIGVLLITLS